MATSGLSGTSVDNLLISTREYILICKYSHTNYIYYYYMNILLRYVSRTSANNYSRTNDCWLELADCKWAGSYVGAVRPSMAIATKLTYRSLPMGKKSSLNPLIAVICCFSQTFKVNLLFQGNPLNDKCMKWNKVTSLTNWNAFFLFLKFGNAEITAVFYLFYLFVLFIWVIKEFGIEARNLK